MNCSQVFVPRLVVHSSVIAAIVTIYGARTLVS